MEKCPYYHTNSYQQGECWGTKETEYCHCQGNQQNCDFYPFAYFHKDDNNVSENKVEYLTLQEIINIVNQAAFSAGKHVPEEFYKQLYKGV